MSQTKNINRVGNLSFLGKWSGLCLALAGLVFLGGQAHAQSGGFLQTGAGPYDYNNTANWVGGTINGSWESSLTVTVGQVLEFSTSTVLTTGLTFRETGGQNKTLRSLGGATTLTLGGDIYMNPAGNVAYTIGSTSGSQNLNVDLGGVVRTVTVFGGGNGGTFGKTFNFTNNVFNGGILASGGGSGGGKIQFNGLAISLASAEVRDAELSFNGSGNSSANSAYSISGALTAGGGASTVTVLAKTSATARNALVQAGSFARSAGSTVLFRGTSLGTQTIASATGGVSNISFGSISLTGGGGANGTTTISIIAGAFGDTSATGSGFGATAGLVTYDTANGVRLLSGSEYTSAISDGQTQLDNVLIANSSGSIATTTLTASTTTINSLSLNVSGATGNQGITITGDPGTTLKLNSGMIYAQQAVTGTNSASTDAMTISVPTLDLNGKEGIIIANTKLNTGGTVISNGGLIITSTITNGTGLTIGDGFLTNASGYVVLGGASANTYTGNTTINGAIVRFEKSTTNTFGNVVLNLGSVYNTGNQIADASNLTINGGTFFLNGSNNSGSATNETLNNLTMGNGTVSSGSGNGNTFNVNGNASLSGGTINMPQNSKLNIAGDTDLAGGVISVGTNNSASVYNSKTTLTGAVGISNTAQGTAAYTPITIAAGSASGNLGGQVELSGDLTFTGNTNTNTVTIAAPTGTGLQGVMALNGVRTFNIGNGSAAADLTVNAPLINGTATGGLTKTGLGTLALTGTSTYTGATAVSGGTLLVSGAGSINSTSGVTVNTGGTFRYNSSVTYSGGAISNAGGSITGSGSLGSLTLGGTGSVDPGNSPGLLEAGATDPTGGLDYNFEFTLKNSGLNYASVENDVLRLTSATPFTASLGSGNVLSIYLDAASYASLTNGDFLRGGFYTDNGNFLTSIQGATITAYYQDVLGSTTYNGNTYSLLSGGSFGVTTVADTNFSGSGYLTQFNYSAIPEPSTYALLGLGVLSLWVLRRKKQA